MNSAIMTLNDHVYEVKFGIKSLIRLNKDLYISDRTKLLEQRFYLSDVSELDGTHLTNSEKRNFFHKNINDAASAQWLDDVLSEAETTAMGEYETIDDDIYNILFELLVGQVGIDINSFNSMTLAEIDLVYRGYLKREELKANNILIALRKAKDNKATKISLLGGSGYSYITDREREEILKTLSI